MEPSDEGGIVSGLAELTLGHRQELPDRGEPGPATSVGEEAVMANAVETVGEAVEEEAADELVRIERHLPGRVAMAIIAPAENHAAVVGADQAAVGDGDAMRVAPEIGENVLASAERRLGIDNPVLTANPPHCRSKDIGVVELGERAREAQTTA